MVGLVAALRIKLVASVCNEGLAVLGPEIESGRGGVAFKGFPIDPEAVKIILENEIVHPFGDESCIDLLSGGGAEAQPCRGKAQENEAFHYLRFSVATQSMSL